MLGLIIPYVVGLLLGVPLALRYSRFRDRSVAYRLGVGLLVSVGIAVTLNASLELLNLVGVTTNGQTETVVSADAVTAVEQQSVPESNNGSQQKTWQQEQKYPDGTLRATRTVTRDSNGEVVPHGPATTYHPNGKVKWTGNFEFGQQIGNWQEFYPDGTKEGEGSITADGNADEEHWHDNGKPKSAGTWRHGKKHGLWRTWYASGQKAGEFNYVNGILHGEVREWHATGKAKLEATFANGQLVPPFKRWNEQGDLIASSEESPK